jgi:hypothetical protein
MSTRVSILEEVLYQHAKFGGYGYNGKEMFEDYKTVTLFVIFCATAR